MRFQRHGGDANGVVLADLRQFYAGKASSVSSATVALYQRLRVFPSEREGSQHRMSESGRVDWSLAPTGQERNFTRHQNWTVRNRIRPGKGRYGRGIRR